MNLIDRPQQQTRLHHHRWQREENELINHEIPCRFEPSTHVGWHVDPRDELFPGKKINTKVGNALSPPSHSSVDHSLSFSRVLITLGLAVAAVTHTRV